MFKLLSGFLQKNLIFIPAFFKPSLNPLPNILCLTQILLLQIQKHLFQTSAHLPVHSKLPGRNQTIFLPLLPLAAKILCHLSKDFDFVCCGNLLFFRFLFPCLLYLPQFFHLKLQFFCHLTYFSKGLV